jgi:phenylalanyl-tRNA synthetase alpha chain
MQVPVGFCENDFCEVVRSVTDDLVEAVTKVSTFEHPSLGTCTCYRLNYRSMDRTLTNEEINQMQEQVKRKVVDVLGVTLR